MMGERDLGDRSQLNMVFHDHRKNLRQGIEKSLKCLLSRDVKARVSASYSTEISFVDKLFNACKSDLVPAALSSIIINGMNGKGTLFPDYWGSFMFQDAAYLYKCVENFKLLRARANREYQEFETSDLLSARKQLAQDIAVFAEAMITVFNDAYVYTATQWQIKSPSAVSLGVAIENYSSFEELIFASSDVPLIYAAIAMIPCERLWQELAVNYLKQDDGNLYAFWVDNNATYERVIEQFVTQEYEKFHNVDGFSAEEFFQKALSIYRCSMQGEVNFFNTSDPTTFQAIKIPNWIKGEATNKYLKTKLSLNPAYIHLLHQNAIDNFIPQHLIVHPRLEARDSDRLFRSSASSSTAITSTSNVTTTASSDDGSQVLGDLLWQYVMNKNYPDNAYNTTFIQGIQDVNLRPNNYGAYTIQDAVYLLRASEYFRILNTRANHEKTNEAAKPPTEKDNDLIAWYQDLSVFAHNRADSYFSYWQDMSKVWNIKNPDEIKLDAAVTAYLHLQRDVFKSKKLNLIHSLIVMIPCERLWPWLGRKADGVMKDVYGDARTDTLYYFWIKNNARLSAIETDPYVGKIETKVNQLFKQLLSPEEQAVNIPIAEKIYELATLGEVNFFTSANSDKDAYVIPTWLEKLLQNHNHTDDDDGDDVSAVDDDKA